MDVNGKIAVVTGAGDGMGRELVKQLIAAGCPVAACDVSPTGLAGTVDSIDSPATRLSTHVVDVSDEQAMLRFADEVREQHSTEQIGLLFNNAGIGGGGSLFTDRRSAWDRTFNVDFFGVLNGVRAFLPMLVAADEARIVNTASINGFWASLGPTVPHTAYSAAKFAVKGFTEALIVDLRVNAPHVTCALVMPGHIGTGIVANSRKVHFGTDSDAPTAADVAGARSRLEAAGVPVARLSDDEVTAIIADGARQFTEKAPMTAREAATIILDGVRADRWRILVGEDADGLDRMVRADPENAYTEEFFDSFVAAHGWALGAAQTR